MDVQQRTLSDRRATLNVPVFNRYILTGRRKAARRKQDNRNYYVDLYEKSCLLLFAGIVLFSVIDCFMTLELLCRGAKELNPLMNILIEKNSALYILIKFLMTYFFTIVLLVHKNFEFFWNIKVSHIIYFILTFYIMLVGYELLLFRVIGYLNIIS